MNIIKQLFNRAQIRDVNLSTDEFAALLNEPLQTPADEILAWHWANIPASDY